MLIWVVTGYMSGEWLSLNAGMTGFILMTFFVSTFRIIRMMNGNLEAFVLVSEKVMEIAEDARADLAAQAREEQACRKTKAADRPVEDLRPMHFNCHVINESGQPRRTPVPKTRRRATTVRRSPIQSRSMICFRATSVTSTATSMTTPFMTHLSLDILHFIPTPPALPRVQSAFPLRQRPARLP